jgi:segregation and condensation protein A
MDTSASLPSYTVKTASFEGPLELLLQLVEGRKLFINEISLAAVTDEYLAFARSLPKEDLVELTSFLSIASTLILIKSRSLLPGFIVTKEEEQDIKDLESRLALYALVRELSADLSLRYGAKIICTGVSREIKAPVFAPDVRLGQDLLASIGHEVLAKLPKEEVLPEVRVRKIISIDEMLSSLTERIAANMKVSFRAWQESLGTGDPEEVKGNVIVSFLAMLELVRQGMMDALQSDAFEDIELTQVTEQVDA